MSKSKPFARLGVFELCPTVFNKLPRPRNVTSAETCGFQVTEQWEPGPAGSAFREKEDMQWESRGALFLAASSGSDGSSGREARMSHTAGAGYHRAAEELAA